MTGRSPFSAVVLAGGSSSRMGCDKANLPWQGGTLLERQVTLVQSLRPAEVFVSVREGARYGGVKVPLLWDRFPDSGPLAGIERGLEAASTGLLLVVAVDLPALTVEFLDRLLGHCNERTGAVPVWQGQWEPLVAVYPKRCHALAVDLLVRCRPAARLFAERCWNEGAIRRWTVSEAEGVCLRNCNTPEEWRAAQDGPRTPAGQT
ncbi:molybdenum cofactor guanylyltransferase [Limisphaera sp. 4302-co]|uniref:molybdenum cofactor guanylyltransferase n=1 Tax=Limisphaera sp. 4302-co TaxID=3400417 RepID=UPI003C24C3B8